MPASINDFACCCVTTVGGLTTGDNEQKWSTVAADDLQLGISGLELFGHVDLVDAVALRGVLCGGHRGT